MVASNAPKRTAYAKVSGSFGYDVVIQIDGKTVAHDWVNAGDRRSAEREMLRMFDEGRATLVNHEVKA